MTLAAISRGRATAVPATGDPATGDLAATGAVATNQKARLRRWWEISTEMPSPAAAAASVLAVLAFGVLVGSGNVSYATSPIQLFVNIVHAATGGSSPVTSAGIQSGDSGGSGGSGGSGASGGSGGSGGSVTADTTTTSSSQTTTTTTAGALPPIKHVWVIVLGTQSYSGSLLAASGVTYLNTTLEKRGEVVSQYYGVTQGELANEIAMVSGQGPTDATQDGCPEYSALTPGQPGNPYSQVIGEGCVYPKSTPTLMSELTAAHDTWKVYAQGLGSVVAIPRNHAVPDRALRRRGTHRRLGRSEPSHGARTPAIARVGTVNAAACRHPVVGTADVFQTASNSDPYVTWRDPAVYFRGVTASKACGSDVVGVGSLATDLSSTASTPNVSFIFADPCDDGTATPCHTGAAAGMKPAGAFLKSIVPKIMASAAYKQDGLILITSAQAPQSGPSADSSTCCDNPLSYPNLTVSGSSSGSTGATTTGTTSTGATTTATETQTDTDGVTTTTGTTTDASGTCAGGGSTSTTDTTTTDTMTTSTATTGTGTTTTSTTEAGTGSGTCTAPGGGQVGLLALSPYITPGGQDVVDSFNHFSLLGSIEQLFGLKRLGYAADTSLPLFGSTFYTNYTAGS